MSVSMTASKSRVVSAVCACEKSSSGCGRASPAVGVVEEQTGRPCRADREPARRAQALPILEPRLGADRERQEPGARRGVLVPAVLGQVRERRLDEGDDAPAVPARRGGLAACEAVPSAASEEAGRARGQGGHGIEGAAEVDGRRVDGLVGDEDVGARQVLVGALPWPGTPRRTCSTW